MEAGEEGGRCDTGGESGVATQAEKAVVRAVERAVRMQVKRAVVTTAYRL